MRHYGSHALLFIGARIQLMILIPFSFHMSVFPLVNEVMCKIEPMAVCEWFWLCHMKWAFLHTKKPLFLSTERWSFISKWFLNKFFFLNIAFNIAITCCIFLHHRNYIQSNLSLINERLKYMSEKYPQICKNPTGLSASSNLIFFICNINMFLL